MMIRVAILTVSDSSATGKREDLSGPALARKCEEFNWNVSAQTVVPDDPEKISAQLTRWADGGNADLILTTGGTGIGPRDHTPEATLDILDRELPGIAELLRFRGLEQTPFSVLSRGTAGTRNRTLIVNLPGSPQGAVYSLGIIEPLVVHGIRLLAGQTEH